ncbi:MAG: cytochrome c oxidase assembly protein [Hyphomicrobiales bacterium]
MSSRNRTVALAATAMAAGMLGLAYASVPLYALFCKATGFNGTPQVAEKAPAQATNSFISVRFDANTDSALGWRFYPEQPTMKVRIGDISLTRFVAKNETDHEVTGQAVYNVTPTSAGAYFSKIQCFCFNEQTLAAGQETEMPVQFFVDPDILKDPDTRNISEITLSYTFYPAKPKAAGQQAANTAN